MRFTLRTLRAGTVGAMVLALPLPASQGSTTTYLSSGLDLISMLLATLVILALAERRFQSTRAIVALNLVNLSVGLLLLFFIQFIVFFKSTPLFGGFLELAACTAFVVASASSLAAPIARRLTRGCSGPPNAAPRRGV